MSTDDTHFFPATLPRSVVGFVIGKAMSIGGDLDRGLGGRSRRISAENFFCRPPQNVTFGGDGGGLTVFVNFDI